MGAPFPKNSNKNDIDEYFKNSLRAAEAIVIANFIGIIGVLIFILWNFNWFFDGFVHAMESLRK